jgi:soluble lytic murein transglycosylase-like protein
MSEPIPAMPARRPTARAILAIALALSTSSAPLAPALAADNPCEREMKGAARAYAIPLSVLYAVGLTESGRRESLQPNAMNIDGRPYFAASVEDGLQHFEDARRAGARLIDIGCMQINQHFHGDKFASVRAMFDPHANVEYGARFLRSLHEQEGDWTRAVARYHAGPDNDPEQKKYVCLVIANMVATGFGVWTPEARAFCRQ